MKEKKTFKVTHRDRPAEPWALPNMVGRVTRVTPSGRSAPAQAHVDWDDFCTWEKCADLTLSGDASWQEVRKVLRNKGM